MITSLKISLTIRSRVSLMLHKKVKGQSLVEFALVLPILLMLLLGIIEEGRIIWAYMMTRLRVIPGLLWC